MALALGRTVSELEHSLSSSELTEWMSFFEIEPFGPMRDNLHAGQIAAMLFNVNRKKGSSPIGPGEFMYKDDYARREENTVNFLAGLKTLAKPAND